MLTSRAVKCKPPDGLFTKNSPTPLMPDLLRFHPLYQERVWGGRALETALGRVLPPAPAGPVGESWEIVDRAGAQSVVTGGPLNGFSLRRVLTEHSADVMGPKWIPARPFPIL